MKYARYSDLELERKFVKMYVNELTPDFGEKGRKAIQKYFERAWEMNLMQKFRINVV